MLTHEICYNVYNSGNVKKKAYSRIINIWWGRNRLTFRARNNWKRILLLSLLLGTRVTSGKNKTKRKKKKPLSTLVSSSLLFVPLHYLEIIYNKLYPVKWITFIASIKIKIQNISSTNNGFSYPLQSMPLLPSATGNHWLTSDIMDWFIVYISGKFCAWLLLLSTNIFKPVPILSVSVVLVFYFCFSLLNSIPL